MPDALAFVYNADSGLFNTLADVAHKLLSPSSYACNLCALTHSPLGMRGEWRRFLEGLDIPLEFHHREEREALGLRAELALPVVLARYGDRYDVLVDASRIDAAKSLEELKGIIRSSLPGPAG